jgi:hypothetical protein
MIAALFVETNGCYFGLPNVDPWDKARDARNYRGPYSVVAHPECQRWGRYAENHPIKGKINNVGEDGGCFASALTSCRNHGGVVEHPGGSKAWGWFGLALPGDAGWTRADRWGWTCQVEQGHYGHFTRKITWLYAVVDDPASLPALRWGRSPQKIHPRALELHGYEKARRIGMMAMIGGKDKTRIRNATPTPFRDLLIRIAENARAERAAA